MPAVKRAQPDPAEDPAAAAAYVETLAKRYGSHYDQLSEDDRSFLDGLTAGHGRQLLYSTAQRLQRSALHKTHK